MRRVAALKRAAYGASRRTKKENVIAGNSKFAPGLNPLEEEAMMPLIRPSNKQMTQKIREVIKSLREEVDEGQRAGLDFWLAQAEAEGVQTEVQREFLESFWCWLLGRGTPKDTERTLWGRGNAAVHNPEVTAYVDILVKKRAEFAMQLALMADRVPTTLNGYYLYFKYIVRGQLIRREDKTNKTAYWDMSDEDFLEDWDMFKQELTADHNRPIGHMGEPLVKGGKFRGIEPYPVTHEEKKKEACMDITAADMSFNVSKSFAPKEGIASKSTMESHTKTMHTPPSSSSTFSPIEKKEGVTDDTWGRYVPVDDDIEDATRVYTPPPVIVKKEETASTPPPSTPPPAFVSPKPVATDDANLVGQGSWKPGSYKQTAPAESSFEFSTFDSPKGKEEVYSDEDQTTTPIPKKHVSFAETPSVHKFQINTSESVEGYTGDKTIPDEKFQEMIGILRDPRVPNHDKYRLIREAAANELLEEETSAEFQDRMLNVHMTKPRGSYEGHAMTSSYAEDLQRRGSGSLMEDLSVTGKSLEMLAEARKTIMLDETIKTEDKQEAVEELRRVSHGVIEDFASSSSEKEVLDEPISWVELASNESLSEEERVSLIREYADLKEQRNKRRLEAEEQQKKTREHYIRTLHQALQDIHREINLQTRFLLTGNAAEDEKIKRKAAAQKAAATKRTNAAIKVYHENEPRISV